jgi:polyisoprenoid-binding protein YceI
MKLHILSAALLTAITFTSCGGGNTETRTETTASPANTAPTHTAPTGQAVSYDIDPAASQVNWKGTMLGVKQHFGTVSFVDGNITVQGGQLVDGRFTADLNSIRALDENYAPDTEEQGTRSKLIGHLKSGDFFDVQNHPNATLDILEVNGNTATANFTVRGVTNTETIENIQITDNNGEVRATGTMTFDRQKYGVAWSSGMQDAVLSDNIELNVDLVARAQNI